MKLSESEAYDKARQALRNGRLRTALTVFSAMEQQNKKNLPVVYNLGMLSEGLGESARATDYYSRALILGCDLRAQENILEFFLCFNTKTAVNLFARSMARNQASLSQTFVLQREKQFQDKILPPKELISELLTIYDARDFERAKLVSLDILSSFPTAVIPYKVICVAEQNAGRHVRSLISAQRAILLNSNDAQLYFNAATILSAVNETESAQRHYEKAIELKPDYGEAYNNYANLLRNGGNRKHAGKLLERAVRFLPASAEPHYNYGIYLLASQKNTALAIRNLKKAIKIDPNFRDAKTALGKARLQENQHKKGLELIRKAEGCILVHISDGIKILGAD